MQARLSEWDAAGRVVAMQTSQRVLIPQRGTYDGDDGRSEGGGWRWRSVSGSGEEMERMESQIWEGTELVQNQGLGLGRREPWKLAWCQAPDPEPNRL